MNFKSKHWILFFLIIGFISCKQNHHSESIFSEAKDKILNASSISYKYKNKTDNKFNDTKYIDSAEIIYYRLKDSHHGFGLYALSKSEEYFYDGHDLEKLKHSDKLKVIFNNEEIKKDSNYLYNFPFFSTNPINIFQQNFEPLGDTIVDGQDCFGYIRETQNNSKSDSSKIVKYQKFTFIEKASKNIMKINDLIIRNDETLQVVVHDFQEYKYDSSKTSMLNQKEYSYYQTVNEEDEYEEFTYTPIKEGTILSKKVYTDITNKKVNIFGQPQKSTLIMFSFIGCTACEIALNDFKKVDYKFTNKINFYYSSFQNTGSSLKKYLHKKNIPLRAFGKEANMIEEFSLYHSPSFALIDDQGKIMKVIEGYDDEVKKYLLELLIPS